MTEEQYHLTQVKEELLEVALECIAAISKAIRFGLEDVWPERGTTNRENIDKEINDVYGAIVALNVHGLQHDPNWKVIGERNDDLIDAKCDKIHKWLTYAKEKGQVQ